MARGSVCEYWVEVCVKRRLCIGVAVGAACAGVGVLASVARAVDPVMEIVQLPVPGTVLAIKLRDLTTPVAGWQAFLEFDQSRLSFVTGTYVTTRFGLPVINPIAAVGNQIDLAAGLDPTLNQLPTTVNQDVAVLVFAPVGTGCQPQVRFRPGAVPPTRLTDVFGNDIVPLTTNSPWNDCPADYDHSGFIGVQDIFDFLRDWFTPSCLADFNNMNGVSVQDIFDFLAAWFAGCP